VVRGYGTAGDQSAAQRGVRAAAPARAARQLIFQRCKSKLFSILSSGKVAVLFDNDSHYATYYFNHHWLAGGSAGHAGRRFTFTADHAVYPAGGLVLCPLVAAFSPLAAVSFLVWRLSASLAKIPAMPPGAKPRAIAMILLTFAISLWLVKIMWVRICCWSFWPVC
jgi:hypothetical protein